MPSQINPQIPIQGTPTTQSVRNNFAFAKHEIEAIQQQIAQLPFDIMAQVRQQSTALVSMSLLGSPNGVATLDANSDVNASQISQASVTQHQGALSISQSQITGSGVLARINANETISGVWNFTSPVTVAEPTLGTHAATKAYADTKVAKAGDVMAGDLSFGNNLGITWSTNTDAATLKFVSSGDGNSGTRALSNLVLTLMDNGNEGFEIDSVQTGVTTELFYVNASELSYRGNAIWHAGTTIPATAVANFDASKITSGTVAAGRMPSFTGDATSAAGSTALTLANSGVTAGTYRSVTVDAKGRVTGGTNPTTLFGYGITDAVAVNTNTQLASLGVGTAASGTAGEIRATNNITAYFSDLRLKNVSGTIPDPLDKVMTLSGVLYTNNDVAAKYGYTNSKQQVGVIAQQVQAVLPEAIAPAPFDIKQLPNGTETSASGEHYMTVCYEKLVPLLIEAIKELKHEVDELRQRVK